MRLFKADGFVTGRLVQMQEAEGSVDIRIDRKVD